MFSTQLDAVAFQSTSKVNSLHYGKSKSWSSDFLKMVLSMIVNNNYEHPHNAFVVADQFVEQNSLPHDFSDIVG